MEVEQFGLVFLRLLAVSTSSTAAESSLSKHCISSQPHIHSENHMSFVTQLLLVFLFTSFDGVVLGDSCPYGACHASYPRHGTTGRHM